MLHGWPSAPAAGAGAGQLARPGSRRQRAGTDAVRPPAVAAVLLSLLAAPPVRAAVADWFGFAGVMVQLDAGPGRVDARRPRPRPTAGRPCDAGRGWSASTPSCPRRSGDPDGVEVSADRRVLSMSWSGGADGTVRLDQFDARLDYTVRQDRTRACEFTTVAGDFALWFDAPHEVVLPQRGRHPPRRDRAAGRAHADLGARRHDPAARGRRDPGAGPARSPDSVRARTEAGTGSPPAVYQRIRPEEAAMRRSAPP